MGWQDLIGEPPAGADESPNGVTLAGRLESLTDALDARLEDPKALRAAADAIIDLAHRCGAAALLPASDAGARLVDAARVHESFSADLNGKTALIVDGLLMSGSHILRAAEAARAAGATRVVGVAAIADADALRFVAQDFGDEVFALEAREASDRLSAPVLSEV